MLGNMHEKQLVICQNAEVYYPMHMLCFSSLPFITAYPIDIHRKNFPILGAYCSPRLLTFRLFPTPSPFIVTPLLFWTGEYALNKGFRECVS